MIDIIYPFDDSGRVVDIFREEAACMALKGFNILPSAELATHPFMFRGYMMRRREDYPESTLGVNNYDAYRKTLLISEYLHCISDCTFPTFLVSHLECEEVETQIKSRGWDRAFIKQDAKSLFALGETTSVWPDTSIKEMAEIYRDWKLCGPFAVRKFIDDPQIFYDEQRYWVLKGVTYHPSGVVPDFVKEAAWKVWVFSNSSYFTVDVAGSFVVEVNPGESSDRGGDNSPDFLAEVFAKSFLKE